MANELGIDMDEGWCAGNECQALYKAWEAIASGPTIDDCKKMILRGLEERKNNASRGNIGAVNSDLLPPSSKEMKGLFDDDSDDDDTIPQVATTGRDKFAEVAKFYEVDSDSC